MTPSELYKKVPRKPLLAAVAAAALGIGGLGIATVTSNASEQAAPAAPQAIPVKVAVIEEQTVSGWESFSGRLEAVERVEIRSRVSGAVKSIHFREGAFVRQGDLLVTIDPAPYAAEVARAKAQVQAADARLTLARSDNDRAQRLLAEHAISQAEAESRTNGLRGAEAEVAAARAVLQSANLNLSYTQVRAPVSGRVGRVEITQGNLVASGAGSPLLTTLVSVSPIYASFDANEEVINRTLKDLNGTAFERIPVKLELDDGSAPLDGHLQLIDNQFDSQSGTVRARAVFSNADGRLIPGQFVRVQMGEATAKPLILISELAVGTDQSKRFVYVVGKGNAVEYREVHLGGTVEGQKVVIDGLKPGERVVMSGLQALRPGTVIAPQLVALKPVIDATPKPSV
ncbi:efflux RND transporter periplasmic adaptor subunit [Asticcacaulis sp. BYS171W]|uniref:Efflux RND transporter periplasmic adaptor subunit n=1 Tax=Asticcacaulis aquaticus TaxID=2984212 RepID=A0ABT5HWJ5_9CAUL|nr:efflux RND transporter periplasmic adaptor subunit [Asticcacaulis aquaticus]MDC7684215.1 efflux RND transporter periplasmic adaptor subunit [Asticcacaulis aquaticus]